VVHPLQNVPFFSFFPAIHIVFFDFNRKTITYIYPTKSEHVYTFDGTLSEHAKRQVIVKYSTSNFGQNRAQRPIKRLITGILGILAKYSCQYRKFTMC